MTSDRVTVAQAAAELGMAPYTVRYYMEIGQLPIGQVVKLPGKKSKRFLIFRNKLDAFTGRKT